MQQKKTSTLTWFLLVVILSLVAWFLWAAFGLHVSEPRGPISAAEAESIAGVRVPPEAKNIRAAGYHQWIQYEQYLRFEAPPDVCFQFSATVVPGATTQPIESSELAYNAFPIRPGVFKDISWFDLAQTQDVITAGGGPSQPQVWVDRRRGVFYYRKTD